MAFAGCTYGVISFIADLDCITLFYTLHLAFVMKGGAFLMPPMHAEFSAALMEHAIHGGI
jgi:hypothetical protein